MRTTHALFVAAAFAIGMMVANNSLEPQWLLVETPAYPSIVILRGQVVSVTDSMVIVTAPSRYPNGMARTYAVQSGPFSQERVPQWMQEKPIPYPASIALENAAGPIRAELPKEPQTIQ